MKFGTTCGGQSVQGPPANLGLTMRPLLPMGSIHIRSGQVGLRVGAPITTSGMKVSDREELTQRLYQEISRLLAE